MFSFYHKLSKLSFKESINTKKVNFEIFTCIIHFPWTAFASIFYQSRSHWKCTLGLQNHMIFLCLCVLLSCMICFHVCKPVCFHPIWNAQIVRTFKNRIPVQTFKKWHNVSSRYNSYVKSETADIWITSQWFSKNFWRELRKIISTTK